VLSYFKEISIEQTSSLSNPYLEVLLVQGRHQLVTKDAIYSFDDKYENFNYSFQQIDFKKLSGNKVLLLGLGLGSVIYILEKVMGKEMDYTAVEVDPEICRLCSQYTLDELKSFVEVIPAEAMSFLEYHEEQYDMIIMDIFQSAVIPQKFQTNIFLTKLKSHLSEGGLFLYNRMHITERDKAENKTFRENMKSVFPKMREIKVKTNLVIMNDGYFLK